MILPGLLSLLTSLIAGVGNAENMGELTVGVVATRLGEDEKMLGGTFEPTVQWTRQGTISDYEYTAGVTAKETAGGDFSYDLFGGLRRSLRGWLYDARLDTSSTDLNKINSAFRITAPSRTVLSIDGWSNVEEQSLQLTSFGVEQPFVANEVNGVVRIRCPASLQTTSSSSTSETTTSLQLDCAYRDTLLSLDGTKHRQAMTVVQSFRGRHEIGPTITSDGLWQISYACALPKEKGAVISTYRPNGAVSLEYRGGPLSVSLDVPLKGYYQIEEGARLSFRQTVVSSS